MARALTFTAIFQAQSLNYGEGMGNISELKKFHRGNGDVYTFASRQSIRYDIVRLGNEWFAWNLDTVDKAKGVVQFRKEVTIEDSVEMDLFGYLKTDKNSQKRAAVARLSHALSLEPYKSDIEFLNNMGLAQRKNETPNLANIEQHASYYTYTLTLDLDRVGLDAADPAKDEIRLDNKERFLRVQQLLEIMKLLYRDIRGRRENLSPLFVVGGMYPVSNPFFLGRVRLEQERRGTAIDIDSLRSSMDTTFLGESIAATTQIGLVNGIWSNEAELRGLFADQVVSVDHFFSHLQEEVRRYYEV